MLRSANAAEAAVFDLAPKSVGTTVKAKIAKRFLLLCVALTIAVVVTFGRRGTPSESADKTTASADALALRKLTSLGEGDSGGSALSTGLSSTGLPEIPVFQAPSGDAKTTDEKSSEANNIMPTLNGLADKPAAGTLSLPSLAPLPSLNAPATNAAEPESPMASTTALPELIPTQADSLPEKKMETNAALNPFPKLPSFPPLNVETPTAQATSPSTTADANSNSDRKSSSANELLDMIRAPSPALPKLTEDKSPQAAPAKPDASTGLPPMFSLAPQPAESNPSPTQPKTDPFSSQNATANDNPIAQFAQLPQQPAPLTPRDGATSAMPDFGNLNQPAPLRALPTVSKPSTDALPQTLPSFANPANSASPAPPVAGPTTRTANPYPSFDAAPRQTQPMNRTDTRELRHHRIVDGDTLGTISKRYHGSPDRAMEIFEANRQILRTPDLLPLGARLVVPAPRRSPAPDTSTTPMADPFARRSVTPQRADAMRAIPETPRPTLTPRPTITESGRVQEFRPQTRLVPVPRG